MQQPLIIPQEASARERTVRLLQIGYLSYHKFETARSKMPVLETRFPAAPCQDVSAHVHAYLTPNSSLKNHTISTDTSSSCYKIKEVFFEDFGGMACLPWDDF